MAPSLGAGVCGARRESAHTLLAVVLLTNLLGRMRAHEGGPTGGKMSADTATQSVVPGGRPATRDPFFDNAKLLLVMLVVIGHSWVLMPEAPSAFPAYTFLYAWHVPAFVLVTGYLSRSFTYSRANLRKLMTTVVAPYLVFESL